MTKRGVASRARAWENVADGSGVEPHKITSDLRRAATTREPGVAASIEVVAR